VEIVQSAGPSRHLLGPLAPAVGLDGPPRSLRYAARPPEKPRRRGPPQAAPWMQGTHYPAQVSKEAQNTDSSSIQIVQASNCSSREPVRSGPKTVVPPVLTAGDSDGTILPGCRRPNPGDEGRSSIRPSEWVQYGYSMQWASGMVTDAAQLALARQSTACRRGCGKMFVT
jgi:hypothetical protein